MCSQVMIQMHEKLKSKYMKVVRKQLQTCFAELF